MSTPKRAAASRPAAKSPARKRAARKSSAPSKWDLRLYIAGQTPNSIAAIGNLKKICGEQLDGRYRVEIIDLLKRPQLAQADQIVAIPTLVRRLPAPIKRIIGDLSRAEITLAGLDIKPAR